MAKPDEHGSTLIEIIIAMFILSLIIIGLNGGVASLISSNLNSKELTAASSVGYSLLEELRRKNYDSLIYDGTNTDTVRGKYIRHWVLTKDTTKAKIVLTIRWPKESLRHSIELSTIISKP